MGEGKERREGKGTKEEGGERKEGGKMEERKQLDRKEGDEGMEKAKRLKGKGNKGSRMCNMYTVKIVTFSDLISRICSMGYGDVKSLGLTQQGVHYGNKRRKEIEG